MAEPPPFPGRLAVQQRVLPGYRVPFFEKLAQACENGLAVFAGLPLPIEAIEPARALAEAHLTLAHNRHLFHPRHPLYLCWQQGLLPWLASTQPDVLIVEANPRYPATRQATAWMHARGRPVLGWGLGAPPLSGPLARWRARSRERFLGRLDGLLTYSEKGAAEYRALRSAGDPLFPPERVTVAPNAAAPRPAGPPPDRGPVPTPASVLFVGRLQSRKRVDHLLHACAALPKTLQPRLTIVGEGPAREALARLAAQVYPQAEFPGAVHGEALAPYFAVADLFVLPGTGGLAVQQAMAHALPILVAQGDGTQDDLVRPENGWQVPPGSLPALTTALHEALANPARLREMGQASYRIVAREINLEIMVASFIQTALQAASR